MNNTKSERILNSQVAQNKNYLSVQQSEKIPKNNISSNQFYSPQTSSHPTQRRNSGLDVHNINKGNNNIPLKQARVKTAAAHPSSTYRQFQMNHLIPNHTTNTFQAFQPTLKPIPNLYSPYRKTTSPHDQKYIHQSLQDPENKQLQQQQEQLMQQQNNSQMKGQKQSDLVEAGEQIFNTSRNNNVQNGNINSQHSLTNLHHPSFNSFTAKSYYYSPKKKTNNPPINFKSNTITNVQTGNNRSVSNNQHYRKNFNPNSINSLNNINDFEDTQIFQEFQKPQQSTQGNESLNNQNIDTAHQIHTLQSIPVVKRENNNPKQFSVKTKSASQLQTISGFQKLQRVKKALALGSKVTKFLEILKEAPTQKYDQASEQYSKECVQILKGILQEKESEVDQLDSMDLQTDHDDLEGLSIQKGIGKKTEKLTNKILRNIQDSILEPISQRTYKGLYYEKCKEIGKIKNGYKDMEQELEVLRKNQQVFDDIVTNYFRKTEAIEKEKNKLIEDKKAALLEVERLEKKLDESNNYYSFWQGEYHQVSRKYNEEVYALCQYEEKMKREKTEKVFLENQLSALQKQVENKQGEIEKIRATQVQLKWMKGSISTYQQDLLNKNIQINLCKDLIISNSETLKILPKEELDKEKPLIDLVKQVFNAFSQKINQ